MEMGDILLLASERSELVTISGNKWKWEIYIYINTIADLIFFPIGNVLRRNEIYRVFHVSCQTGLTT